MVCSRSSFAIDAVGVGPPETVLALSGVLDRATAPQLWSALLPFFDRTQRLVLDLAGLDVIDSPGVATLVKVKEALAADGEVVLCRPRPFVRQVFKILDLDAMFTIDDAAPTPDASPPVGASFFETELRWTAETAVLALRGRLDRSALPALDVQIEQLFCSSATALVLDLTALQSADEAGSGSLDGLCCYVESRGWKLVVHRPEVQEKRHQLREHLEASRAARASQ
jgi:anti-anti-sigma factor